MDYYDFQVHLRLCLESENVENEFKITLAGGGKPKKSFDDILQSAKPGTKERVEQEFDPATGVFKNKKTNPTKIYQKFDPKTGRLIGE